MADIATLGLEVKFDSVEDATDALGKFTDASAKAEKGADGLSSKTGKTSDGLGKVASEGNKAGGALDKVEKSMGGVSIAGNFLIGVLGGIGAGLSVKAVIDYADAWSDMQSRVGAAVRNMDAAPQLMRRMVEIANASYSPLSQTVEIYGRNVSVLQALGRTADEAADFTESLNHALVITATKGQQAESVQNALSKAMATGKLDAQGLETVLTNGGAVAEALAEALGTNVNGLRQMATEGRITGDVIANTMIAKLEEFRDRASEMPATVADAFTRINTNFTAFIGMFDQAVGASGALAEVLIVVADNIDRIVVTAGTAATAFGTYYAGAMAYAAIQTGSLTAALRLLRAALISTGIGAIVVLLGELAYQLLKARQNTESWGAAFQQVGQRIQGVLGAIQLGWTALIHVMASEWYRFLNEVVSNAQAAVNQIASIFGGVGVDWGQTITNLDTLAESYGNSAGAYAEMAADAFKNAFAEINSTINGEGGGELPAGPKPPSGGGGAAPAPSGGGGGGGGLGAAAQLQSDLEHRLQALRDYFYTEQELIAQQRAEHMETLELARQAEMLSQDEYNNYKLMVERDFQQKMAALRAQEYADALNATGDLFGAMASLTSSGNEKLLKMQKIAGAAAALVSTFVGAAKALELPFPANLAAVATVLAKGMSLVAAIRSGNKSAAGGGGGSSYTPPVQSAAPAQPEVKPMQAVELKMHGEVFTRETVADLIDKINDMGKDGYNIVVRTA